MEENKKLQALRDALAKCNGVGESVALIYCDNNMDMSCEAFVGDSGKMAQAIRLMLDRVGEGRALPSECAITFAMLWGIAQADLTHGGSITQAIEEHKQQILATCKAPDGKDTES